MNLGTPTLHPGESPPTNTLVQPPSCILNPLQREKLLLHLHHWWYWRALGTHGAVLSPWGVCPALRGSGSPWGQCCCPQPPPP